MKETTPKQNIYSKLNFVNCLTDKEISKLNSKYLSSGLQMKQIKVDEYGKEIIEENSKRKILGRKRDRKDFNSYNKFLSHYYGKQQFDILNQNYEKEKKMIFDFDPEDKSVVLIYISQFRKYITSKQYTFLYNKWKNELLKVRGTDLFNFDKINNINNWKVSILRCFKSEIVLYAICNVYDEVIKGKKFVSNNKIKLVEDSEEKEEEKIDESEEVNDSSSDSEITEKSFEENIINS